MNVLTEGQILTRLKLVDRDLGKMKVVMVVNGGGCYTSHEKLAQNTYIWQVEVRYVLVMPHSRRRMAG